MPLPDKSLIIKKPHQTEKAGLLDKENKYVFQVRPEFNKVQIKKEAERLYKVKVKKVNLINLPSKRKKISRQVGYESGLVKAIVTLQKGNKITLG